MRILIPLLLLLACRSPKPISDSSQDIRDKHWRLFELNGNAVQTRENTKGVYMVLHTAENRVNGNGGCNSFFGTYELKDEGRISFSPIGSTKMACPALDTESLFFEMLSKTDSYHLRNDTLQLFRARMAPLAKFVVVPDTK